MNHGVLLINLGSPNSPARRDIRKYLREFLMDPHVLNCNYMARWFLVNCLIIPKRQKTSSIAYQSIWTDTGSPLVEITRCLQAAVQRCVDYPVEIAMRYGDPSIRSGLIRLITHHRTSHIHVIPLYPQYARSSYETVVQKVTTELQKISPTITLSFQPPFYNNKAYIQALLASAKTYLATGYDHLLFSYHGLPERHIIQEDPTGKHCLRTSDCCTVESTSHARCYRAQVYKTTALFTAAANIPKNRHSISFQSRLGKEKWLTPYTDKVLDDLARQGIKRLLVMCPAFVSDCLETLEEIGMRGKEIFKAAGGSDFQLIPCLNTHPEWVRALCGWIRTI